MTKEQYNKATEINREIQKYANRKLNEGKEQAADKNKAQRKGDVIG